MILSSIFDKMELLDSFSQTSIFMKPITQALKKNPIPLGNDYGLAPVLLMLEPVLPPLKGNNILGNSRISEKQIELQTNKLKISGSSGGNEPKGQAQAQALAQQNAIATVMGINNTQIPSHIEPHSIKHQKTEIIKITAIESIDLLNDFSQMVDILADRCNVRRPKKLGGFYCKNLRTNMNRYT